MKGRKNMSCYFLNKQKHWYDPLKQRDSMVTVGQVVILNAQTALPVSCSGLESSGNTHMVR